MNPIAEDVLMHYGKKYRSGRYPWGSGKDPYQHSGDFLSRFEELEGQGLTEKQIAEEIGLSTTDLRMQVRVAKHERRELARDRAKSLREDGKSLNEIARIMGYDNDSSVRSLLNENTAVNKNRARATADILKKEVDEKNMVDVGGNVHLELGCSEGTLNEALFILETKGYKVYGVGVPQVTNKGRQTNTVVLCKPDVEYRDVYQNMGDIQSVVNYHSTDGGTSYNKLQYPSSIDSSRVYIRYGDQGGIDKDGVIELRRGVPDLDLGNSSYAQVRIMVDGTHYLKGMAIYSDDMPPGADVIFNTNKQSGTPKEKGFKAIKDDPDNPFGALIKAGGQSYYTDENGEQKLSAINKLKEEGDWDKMSRTLSSQFLSKQPIKFIKNQLNVTYADRQAEYDEICSYTNPTVKKKLLLDFADECDSAAMHLKAAALPRQTNQVILPCTALKDTEVYAPNYKNGEQIALVRYPHGGTFEIPILTVNNKNATARSIFGTTMTDAIGINPKVAERLSGADFDGDSVVAIPLSDKVRVESKRPLDGLIGFDPKVEYAVPEGNPNNVKIMSEGLKGREMGMISNLITDMTLRGAPEDEMVRAVKHSMVVIDAPKHKLDYKRSERENGIAELKNKWQGYTDDDGKRVGGASTLISRRKQDVWVDERQGSPRINTKYNSKGELNSWYDPSKPEGAYLYKSSNREYTDKKGVTVRAQTRAKLLKETDDLHKLSSGTLAEEAYADYGNKMKALGNQARKEYISTTEIKTNASAKSTYSTEVDSLNAKLRISQMNAPRERRAQIIANSRIKAKIQDNPWMDKKDIKKVSQIELNKARIEVGADGKGTRINITPKEWDAIQAGAISPSKLSTILKYADSDQIREYALPRATTTLSSAKVSKLKHMAAIGYTNEEIARAIGCSTSSVSKYLNA